MTWIKANRAIGIGSLPHTEISAAFELISRTFPHWPHWSQLPQRCKEQGFVMQYVQPLVKAGLLQPEGLYFARNTLDWSSKLSHFYELYAAFQADDSQAMNFFCLEPDAFSSLAYFLTNLAVHFPVAEGVKGQISGPLSVGLQIKDECGQAAFYDKTLRDLLVKCLAAQGVLQARKLQSTGLPVLLFIDDPCLFFLDDPAHNALTCEAAAALMEIIQPLKSLNVKVGVHVCAPADWSILFALPLDVVSFDAYTYFDSMKEQAQNLQDFLLRGGKLAWGLVPTSEEAWQTTAAGLAQLFEQQCTALQACGLDVSLLRRNIIWTPSCGTGMLEQKLARHIYRLLTELTQLYEKNSETIV